MIVTREERIKLAQKKIDDVKDEYERIKKEFKPIKEKYDKAKDELEFANSFKNIGEKVSWVEYSGNHGRDIDEFQAYVIGYDDKREEYEVKVIPYGNITKVRISRIKEYHIGESKNND